MEGSIVDLSKYRLERAREDFKTANDNFVEGSYRASVNRSYYAIFHAMRAITALDEFDSSKHSGVIAYINRQYVKEGIFNKELSKILDSAFRLREKADYDDFYIVSIEDAENQLKKASRVLEMTKPYLEEKWKIQ